MATSAMARQTTDTALFWLLRRQMQRYISAETALLSRWLGNSDYCWRQVMLGIQRGNA